MSDQQPPPDEPSFAHYWAWVAREKIEQEVYRLIRTTPGIVDRSHVVEDIEAASKQLVASRREHLQDLLDGWAIMEKTMNREIAIRLFNEFIAGSRTLEDFENLNFSKKNKDQQGKPRSHFPAHLNGNPILSQASIADLEKNGALPTTSIVYSSPTAEFYTEKATDKYYDLIFGDSKIFYDILQKFNPSPNMPVAKAIPMPYHPNMDKQDKDFLRWHQVVSPYTKVQQQVPMQFVQPPPQVPYTIAYQQMPAFIPMVPMQGGMQGTMQPIPMQAAPENMYVGVNYQKGMGNGFYGSQRGSGIQRPYKGRLNRAELHGKYANGYDNYDMATSSSSGVSQKQSTSKPEEEKPSTSKVEETLEEAFPALEGQDASTSLNVDISAPEQEASTSTDKMISTPRKFSDVVSHSVSTSASASASTADASEGSMPAAVDEVEDERDGPSPPSTTGTPSGASDSRSVTSESLATTSDPTTSSSGSTAAGPPVSKSESIPATSALVVDTTECPTPIAPPTSQRTVAEVVQQNLPTPSPSPASAAVKSNTPAASPVVRSGARNSQNRSSQGNINTVNQKKPQRSPKKPSTSYAQMLYPKAKGSTKSSKQSSSGSANQRQQQSTSSPAAGDAADAGALPTDWHTVKNKKASDPSILSPPIQTPELVKKPAPKQLPEPTGSDEQEEEEVTSDDPEAEKKREKRRLKRQKLKEQNRQQKQHEKEMARQESLARVELMNGESSKRDGEDGEEKIPTPPPKPAFDPTDLAARRRKRQQLQKKTELESSTSKIPSTSSSPSFPIIPIIPTGMGAAPLASITAGQAAMAAYGLNTQFRHRSSPFSLIAANGSTTLPLYLPPQEGLRTNQDGFSGLLLEETSDNKLVPFQLIRQLDPNLPVPARTQMDDNAFMIEKLLLFDSMEKIQTLTIPIEDLNSISNGLEDTKKMYVRVEKAGQLISYKTGSSKVNSKTEEKLLYLATKLLNNRTDLDENDNRIVSEIGRKIAHSSSSFNYTNYITALVDFAQERANQLPDSIPLKKNYEQCVVLTKVYLQRTKTLYEKVSKYFDIANLTEEPDKE